jgi:hypothetical protein
LPRAERRHLLRDLPRGRQDQSEGQFSRSR